ncbi:hypothetical protein JTE90_020675 [Oedothorax gibbosus]|uniref:Uncharacterized protein n=1 Tax=Oedothorax gibbosus TaxID=931172 RepID=A0AAV6UTY4_9ARAC|nr:hypothetical protein JTE90_020675 [Oedothorax gibbosus]
MTVGLNEKTSHDGPPGGNKGWRHAQNSNGSQNVSSTPPPELEKAYILEPRPIWLIGTHFATDLSAKYFQHNSSLQPQKSSQPTDESRSITRKNPNKSFIAMSSVPNYPLFAAFHASVHVVNCQM